MINLTNDIGVLLGVVMVIAFAVNIIVQLTKGFIKIPTKLWCIIVSASVMCAVMLSGVSLGIIKLSLWLFMLCLIGSFVIAYIAMYGFDTFKDLWQRFREGENINE